MPYKYVPKEDRIRLKLDEPIMEQEVLFLDSLVGRIHPKFILELGCCLGDSTSAML